MESVQDYHDWTLNPTLRPFFALEASPDGRFIWRVGMYNTNYGEYQFNFWGYWGYWGTPTLAGIGGSLWVRASLDSGSLSFGTLGQWVNLGSGPQWIVVSPPGQEYLNVYQNAVVRLQIAWSNGGAVVAEGTRNITAGIEDDA